MDTSKKTETIRILHVEDNQHDRVAFERIFKESTLPYAITCFDRAERALEEFEGGKEPPFDVVVSDHGLPGMSGLEFCKKLLARKVPIALILLTGEGNEEVAVDAMKSGIDDYITKDPTNQRFKLLPYTIQGDIAKHGEKKARIEAEEAFLHSEKKYTILVNTTPQGIQEIDTEGNILFGSPAWHEMLGYPNGEMIGLNLREILPEKAVNRTMAYIASLISDQPEPTLYIDQHQKKDGTIIDVEVAWNYKRNEKGKVIGFVSIIFDITERKLAEEALHQYKYLVSSSTDMQALLDRRYVYLAANPMYLELLDKTADEVIGRTPADVFGEVFFRTVIKPNGDRCLAGEDIRYQHWVEFPVIGRKYMDVSYSPYRGPDNKIRGFVVTTRDISENKKAEQKLRDSEAKFRTIFEHATDAIWLVHPGTGQIVTFNKKAHQSLGYTYEEFSGFNISDIEVIESGEDTKKYIEAVLEKGEETFQTRYRTKEGEIRDIKVSVSEIKLEEGEFFLLVLHDFTEKRQAEKRERLSKIVFEKAAEGIMITDANLQILSVNAAFTMISGYSSEEAVGKTPRLLRSGRHDKAFYEAMQKSILATDHWGGEIWNKRKNGEIYLEWLSITAVKDEEGKTVQYTGLFSDITRRKKLEDLLLQTQKFESIGQIAGGIAHEFNNLLTPIIGYVDIITMQTSELPKIQKYLSMVKKAAARAATLTQELLNYSRKSPTKLQSQSLLAITEEVLALLRQTMDRRIKITLESADNLCPVFVDSSQMHQVILNFCINARDALQQSLLEKIGSQPFIQIKIKNMHLDEKFCASHPGASVGDKVCLSVSDNGSGIDEAILPKIFDPFFTTKEVGEGTGLGLASCFGIIKRHGGWIGVTSEQGKGSTFEIYLPRSERLVELPTEKLSYSADMRNTETILLVDDDELVRDLGKAVLEERGYKVLLAEDGDVALEIFSKEYGSIALVVLDLTMPRISGWEVFRRLHLINPDVKVVLCSGHDVSGQASEMKDLGSFNILSKPFTPSKMEQTIRKVLDQGCVNQ